MHVDLYTCLAGDLGKVFTVAHKNVVMDAYALKSVDSDIRADSGGECLICNVPTKYEARGIIVVNVPILFMGLAIVGALYYMGRRRR
jgi:hypothetical protein